MEKETAVRYTKHSPFVDNVTISNAKSVATDTLKPKVHVMHLMRPCVTFDFHVQGFFL